MPRTKRDQVTLAELLAAQLTSHDDLAWLAGELEALASQPGAPLNNPRWRQALYQAVSIITEVDGLRSAMREAAARR